MQAMVWWLIPITATLLAVAWVAWRARPKRPADPHETLAAHRRFTEALTPTERAAHERSELHETRETSATEPRRSA